MSFAWETYLSVAEILLGIRTPPLPTTADREMVEEAHCRIAISRAYYAAYCAARHYARDVEGLGLRGGGEDHGTVIRHYTRGSRIHRTIAVTLRRLRDAGTGVTVQRIVGWYKLGLTPEEIADRVGHLSLAQVHAALTYYHANQDEIEADIAAEDGKARALEQDQAGRRGIGA